MFLETHYIGESLFFAYNRTMKVVFERGKIYVIHTYEEAIGWIHSRLKFGIKPGLERMRWMLEELGNPERHIKCVHLAGTNGKGSTLTYMRYMLEGAKYKVGTFTSPYIESFNERISVNGTPIADEEITELVKLVKPVVEKLDETDLGKRQSLKLLLLWRFAISANSISVMLFYLKQGLVDVLILPMLYTLFSRLLRISVTIICIF